MSGTINNYIRDFNILFNTRERAMPWEVTQVLDQLIRGLIDSCGADFTVNEGVAIHKTAVIEEGVVIKSPAIINANCFVGAHAYLRQGAYLDYHVSVGPGCEIKSSMVGHHSALAHFNFVGDSIVGSYVNLEAGAVFANHYNERKDKQIFAMADGKPVATGVTKFGALVGDNCKIGANAVLSPGTMLAPGSVVKRLELVEQVKDSLL